MSYELLAEAMKIDAFARRNREDPVQTCRTLRLVRSAATPSNLMPLSSWSSGPRPGQGMALAETAPAAPRVLRLVHSSDRNEQQELKSLLDGLERFELAGDVGRMVYLAFENAADEQSQLAKVETPTVRRRHALKRLALRVLRALRPTS